MTFSTNKLSNSNKKTQQNKNNINLEKCKMDGKIMQKSTKSVKLTTKLSKSTKTKIVEDAYKTDLICYIKTLLEAYRTLPNILKILDKIIEKRASTIMPNSYIYGNSPSSTYNEIDKVINLTERKNKLINIFVMTETMLNSLNEQDKKICKLKFIKKCLVEDIAIEFKTTERTIFRRCHTILDKLAIFCATNNWNSAFIKNQINDEQWLFEIFKKKQLDLVANKKQGIKSQSKSSSSTIS